MKSIQRFLLIGLLGSLLFSFLVIFLFNRYQTQVEIGELYDTQLAQTSRIVQAFVDRPTNQIDFEHINRALLTATENYNDDDESDNLNNTEKLRSNEGHEYEHKFAIQIWDKDKKLLVKSPAAPEYPITNFKDGYSNVIIDSFEWSIFAHKLLSNGYWVMVAERGDVRDDMIDKLTISSLIGPFLGMALLAIGVVFVVTRGLYPLINLSQQIRERHIDKLEPLELKQSPTELKPLGQAVNLLMARVSQDVERERRFLGDIAHELRTPLAAMKLNAQNGLHTKDMTALQNFLNKIVGGVDRSNRLIEQLLTLARLDPRALGEREICKLADIAQEVLGNLSHQYLLNNPARIKLDASLNSAQLVGYPELIGVLLRNLIDNACRYTPSDSTVTVSALQDATGNIMLQICDQGPGVSEMQLTSLGKRFFREHPADRMGSGLGLSIVARIAELHNAKLHFSNSVPQGLQVTISFPNPSILS